MQNLVQHISLIPNHILKFFSDVGITFKVIFIKLTKIFSLFIFFAVARGATWREKPEAHLEKLVSFVRSATQREEPEAHPTPEAAPDAAPEAAAPIAALILRDYFTGKSNNNSLHFLGIKPLLFE